MTNGGPVVRPVGIAARALLAELHARSVTRNWDANAFARLLAMPGSFALIGLAPAAGPARPDRPVGCALGRLAADAAELWSLAVVPEARRQGVGRALMATVLARATAGGARQVVLQVDSTNGPARALYLGFGFREVGRRAEALILVRNLGDPVATRRHELVSEDWSI